MSFDEAQWEEVEVPAGNFIKFENPGDGITGKVATYSQNTGATTYDGDECGYIAIEDGDGELWTVTLDKGALKTPVAAASPRPGMLIDIRMDGWQKSKNTGREYKTFKVRVAANAPTIREKQQAVAAASRPRPAPSDSDELF